MQAQGMKAEQALDITRVVDAPVNKVFEAWSQAEHVRHWFCPDQFTIPEAAIDFREGGTSRICMRGPDGTDHVSEGVYRAIVAPSLIVSESRIDLAPDQPFFSALTTARFDPEGDGTRIAVTQEYTLYTPDAEAAIKGAPAGWRQTLDKLEAYLAR